MRKTYTIPLDDGGAPPGRPAPRLAELQQTTHELADYPGQLGLDRLSDTAEGEGEAVTVDTSVLPTAGLYALLLEKPPAPIAALAPAGARLTDLLKRREDVGALREAAEQADADLADTDRAIGVEERALQDEVDGVLGALLSGQIGGLSEGERERLRHDAAEVLGLREGEQRARRDAAEATREAKQAHRAAIEEIGEQEHLAEVMLALQHERPIDDAELEQAISSFDALQRT